MAEPREAPRGSGPQAGETRWFRGALEGHCVGTRSGAPVVSSFASARRYRLRIYRALIRDIEMLPDAEPPSTGEFYQARIDDARLIGIRPGRCFEGTVHDVSVREMQITHSATKGEKTYGRVVGTIVARCVLPPAPDVAPAPLSQIQEEASGSGEALTDPAEAGRAASEDGPSETLHPPAAPADDDWKPADVPAGFLVAVTALLLGLALGKIPALFWIGYFTPILIIRYMLHGMFRARPFHRVIGAIIVVTQAGFLGAIALDWWTAGCISVRAWQLGGVAAAVFVASLLPSVATLLWTAAGFALSLFLYFGDIGTSCAPPEPARPERSTRPTVSDPGIPRTDENGKWPRRPGPVNRP